MPAALNRMIYVDDSGHPSSGFGRTVATECLETLRSTEGLGVGAVWRRQPQSHRSLKLADRRVIEDAIHIDSKTSQLVQMADLVAWSANTWVDRHRGNKFAWEWYSTYLAERDPLRVPREI